jgi:hypothetical protein
MSRRKKPAQSVLETLERRVQTLRNELEAAERTRDHMLEVVQKNPDDSWAAGMARHYTKAVDRLTEQLGHAVSAASKLLQESQAAGTAGGVDRGKSE